MFRLDNAMKPPAGSAWRRSVMGLCLAAIAAAGASCSKNAASGSPGRGGRGDGRPVPVAVARAQTRSMPVEASTFGTVQPSSAVAVKAEVGGILTRVHFRKGQFVRKGDLLYTIDSRQYEAALKQAQAAAARDRVQETNARKELAREDELLKKGISSASDYDKKAADADTLAAVVNAEEAAVEIARLQVERCAIRSPIDGRAGDLLLDQGNLVKAGDQTLVVLHEVQPIEIAFALPQRELPAVRKYQALGSLIVRAWLPQDADEIEAGELTFIDNQVDKTTGTFQLKATFPNKDERLWPGLYVNVSLRLASLEAVVVPERAVQTGQNGKYVFVVKADKTAEYRPVAVRPYSADWAIVEMGVASGETVVTDGHLRVTNGTKVEIKPEVGSRPAGDGAPAKSDSAGAASSGPESRPAGGNRGGGRP
jgi:membrane fusion protein, multidrug efflux system